jgi:gas vesicle protein
MAFRQGFLLGAAVGAVATVLYTPLEGRDTRAILLGPFGWREVETEPEVTWTPHSTDAAPTTETASTRL